MNGANPLSLFYYARGLEWTKVGDSHTILTGALNDISAVILRVTGEERVTIPNFGVAECWVVTPVGNGGVKMASFRGATKIWIEKKTRAPVKLELDYGKVLGSATAILTEIEGNNDLLNALKFRR